MATPSKVSVIIPIYNAEPYLDQALSSVRNQTLQDIEILCLNDGSTDTSLDTMRRHAQEDDRIVIIDKKNEGYGATCNRGIAEAHGSYIAIFEPDDWIEPGMFADMLAFADSLSCGIGSAAPVDIIKTPFFAIRTKSDGSKEKYPCYYTGRIKPKSQPFRMDDPGVSRLLSEHPSIWSALYLRDFLITNDIRFPEYPGAGWADNPFLIETLCTGRIAYLDTPYYCYRLDTAEQAEAFMRANPTLALERWHTMLDILESSGVTTPSILQAHYRRGFVYLNGTIDTLGWDYEGLAEEAARMYGRMDEDLVMSDLSVSNKRKRSFCKVLGRKPHIPYAQRFFHVAAQSVDTGVRLGPAALLRALR